MASNSGRGPPDSGQTGKWRLINNPEVCEDKQVKRTFNSDGIGACVRARAGARLELEPIRCRAVES